MLHATGILVDAVRDLLARHAAVAVGAPRWKDRAHRVISAATPQADTADTQAHR